MKLGLGFHRERITRENFRFARQAGCTHVIVHLVDRFKGCPLPNTDATCFGMTRAKGRVWSFDELRSVSDLARDEGLQLEAIENIDPSFWSDILLDGPKKQEQFDGLKQLVRDMGRLEIPILGYYFSLAGVWGRVETPVARGQAIVPAFLESQRPEETPLPRGQLGNIVYDRSVAQDPIEPIAEEQFRQRLVDFLAEITPVAEECGVRLAAHPDDPPVAMLRGTPRLLYQPHLLQRLLESVPSHANMLQLCVGSVQEMTEGDIYSVAETLGRQNAIAYVHLRNVRGKAPNYRETFIDDGDVDVFRLLRVLHKTGFNGVVIPDHAPQMTCPGAWHAGMAHALGYIRAALQEVGVMESQRR